MPETAILPAEDEPPGTELERLRSELAALRQKCATYDAWFHSLDQHCPFEIWFKDTNSRYQLVNREFEHALGLPRERLLGKKPEEIFPLARAERLRTIDQRVMKKNDALKRIVPCDDSGVRRTFEEIRFPVYDANDKLIGLGCVAAEISGRNKVQEALERAQSVAGIGHWRWSIRHNCLISCSEEFTRIHGATRNEIFALAESRIDKFVHPDEQERVRKVLCQAIQRGSRYEVEYRILLSDRSVRHLLEIGEVLLDSSLRPSEHIGTVQDITERRETERSLRASNTLKSTILDSALDCVISIDKDGRVIEWNAAAEKTFGYCREKVIGQRMVDLIVPSADREAHNTGFSRFLTTGQSRIIGQRTELRAVRASGEEFPIEIALNSRRSGSDHIITAYVRDLTQVKEAEEKLRQAQKMEALGQLTGGVAHDFNNLLSIIMGNAELIAEKEGSNDQHSQAIIRASARGAKLTQHLLAFARQQSLQPRSLDLGSCVASMTELLKRTLGESVEIVTKTSANPWHALADQTQLENAVLNMALNARDAMPGGGTLTIECANECLSVDDVQTEPEVLAGEYAVLTVTDSGTGMSEDTRKQAFDPFFTTKEVGQGSGLGLSMVYGFAKQSGGHALIHSQKGQGTTIKIYLPRASEANSSEDASESVKTPHGNGETVLILEDDADVRELTKTVVEMLGYRTVTATDAKSAWKILEEEKCVDVCLSDVGLPGGISGPEFAKRSHELYPELKFIFMSGYTADSEDRDGLLDTGSALLKKPFQKSRLATALYSAIK